MNGVWHFCIHEQAAKNYFKKFPPREVVQDAFKNSGFTNYTEIQHYEKLIGLSYYDASFPLSEANRKTISFFADAEQYMDEYLTTLREMILTGKMP